MRMTRMALATLVEMMNDCEHIAVLAGVLLQPYLLLSYYVVADTLLLLPAFSLVLLPPSLLVLMLPVAMMIGGDHVTAQADCLEQSPYQAASYCICCLARLPRSICSHPMQSLSPTPRLTVLISPHPARLHHPAASICCLARLPKSICSNLRQSLSLSLHFLLPPSPLAGWW